MTSTNKVFMSEHKSLIIVMDFHVSGALCATTDGVPKLSELKSFIEPVKTL